MAINWLLRDSLISSPVLTAKWEEEYQKIADGQDDPSRLVKATAKMVSGQFQKVSQNWNDAAVKKFYSKVNSKFLAKASLGTCPKCKNGEVIYKKTKKSNLFCCSNEDCNFIIWEKFSNKKITQNDMIKLLEGKETRIFKGVKSLKKNSDKKFDCRFKLVYNTRKDKYYLQCVFEKTIKETAMPINHKSGQ